MDLVISDVRHSNYVGRVYVFYQKEGGGFVKRLTPAMADFFVGGENVDDLFGISLASGDLNSDKKVDLIVGASGYPSGTSSGKIYAITSEVYVKKLQEEVPKDATIIDKIKVRGKVRFK